MQANRSSKLWSMLLKSRKFILRQLIINLISRVAFCLMERLCWVLLSQSWDQSLESMQLKRTDFILFYFFFSKEGGSCGLNSLLQNGHDSQGKHDTSSLIRMEPYPAMGPTFWSFRHIIAVFSMDKNRYRVNQPKKSIIGFYNDVLWKIWSCFSLYRMFFPKT